MAIPHRYYLSEDADEIDISTLISRISRMDRGEYVSSSHASSLPSSSSFSINSNSGFSFHYYVEPPKKDWDE